MKRLFVTVMIVLLAAAAAYLPARHQTQLKHVAFPLRHDKTEMVFLAKYEQMRSPAPVRVNRAYRRCIVRQTRSVAAALKAARACSRLFSAHSGTPTFAMQPRPCSPELFVLKCSQTAR